MKKSKGYPLSRKELAMKLFLLDSLYCKVNKGIKLFISKPPSKYFDNLKGK